MPLSPEDRWTAMKRLIALGLVLAAVLGGAVAALPFLVSSESVRVRIIEQAQTLTGRRMSFRAAPKVFFNPYLGIAIDSVIFEGPNRRPEDPPLVEMEELRGRVAILPALIGRVEVTQYQFVRPRFNLKVFADGHVSWQFPNGKVWQLLEQAREKRQATEPNAKVDLSGIKWQRQFSEGLAEYVIVDHVTDNSYDLVSMGSLGRGFLRGMLIGNTAEKVLRSLPASLLTVKPDDFVLKHRFFRRVR